MQAAAVFTQTNFGENSFEILAFVMLEHMFSNLLK